MQEQFVDAPQAAVTGAQTLVTAVMDDRGYPTDAYDQIVADLSVEHAATLDHFRAAHDISQRAAGGTASTEDLRQAMIHYRALFTELLGQPGSTPDRRAARQDGVPAAETGAGTAGDHSAPGSVGLQSASYLPVRRARGYPRGRPGGYPGGQAGGHSRGCPRGHPRGRARGYPRGWARRRPGG